MLNNRWEIYRENGEYCGYVYANANRENLKDLLRNLRVYNPYAINTTTKETIRLKIRGI